MGKRPQQLMTESKLLGGPLHFNGLRVKVPAAQKQLRYPIGDGRVLVYRRLTENKFEFEGEERQ